MKNPNKKNDAATSSNTRRQDKKQANTKVNPVINFQIGLIAALVAAFLIIELNTAMQDKVLPDFTNTRTIAIEPNVGPFTIVPNEPVEQVKTPVKETAVAPTETSKVNDLLPPDPVDNDQSNAPVSTDKLASVTSESKTLGNPATTATSTTGETAPSSNAAPANAHIATVHEVPLFPGCDPRLNRTERIDCLNKKMARYVQRKFDNSLGRDLGKDKILITVQFTIGVDGFPKNILVRAPSSELQQEARDVISKLPQIIPGKVDGAAVNVTYTLPIVFHIE